MPLPSLNVLSSLTPAGSLVEPTVLAVRGWDALQKLFGTWGQQAYGTIATIPAAMKGYRT